MSWSDPETACKPVYLSPVQPVHLSSVFRNLLIWTTACIRTIHKLVGMVRCWNCMQTCSSISSSTCWSVFWIYKPVDLDNCMHQNHSQTCWAGQMLKLQTNLFIYLLFNLLICLLYLETCWSGQLHAWTIHKLVGMVRCWNCMQTCSSISSSTCWSVFWIYKPVDLDNCMHQNHSQTCWAGQMLKLQTNLFIYLLFNLLICLLCTETCWSVSWANEPVDLSPVNRNLLNLWQL